MTGEGLQKARVCIERLTVRSDRVVCEIYVPAAYRRTTPQLAARICADYPSLAAHACTGGTGEAFFGGGPKGASPTFAGVIGHTSLAHLFEHLVLDLQVRASPHPDASFVGTSEWIEEEAGLARIEVSFTDDLVALRAFRNALEILDQALVK